ncbi:MAG: cytochrome c4 [Kangiellaceae bacterium]|nr:cytochrome c4 [Kangiellaceae bacterium]
MKKLAIFALILLGASVSAQAGDEAKGAQLAAQCAACHGKDGNSTTPMWPKLAGQNAEYIVKQLMDFKVGAADKTKGRYEASMAPMAANLSEQDMQDLAAYYMAQETQMGAVKAEFLELGKKIYFQGDAERGVPACAACHGATGQGLNLAKYPSVSGQHPQYAIKQLKMFAAGERNNDEAAVMRDIAIRMSEQQIEAVANFMLGLH